jgi:hypothetical protein
MSERFRSILSPLVPKLNLGTSADRLRGILERLVIVLGVLSFWPWILGQSGRRLDGRKPPPGWWYQCGTLFVAEIGRASCRERVYRLV